MRVSSTLFALATLALASASARAQYPLQDFAATQCGAAEVAFHSGMESAEQPGVRASGGAGGASGAQTLTVTVPDSGRTHTLQLFVPSDYHDGHAWPLVVGLHGAAGSPAGALTQSGAVRTLWQSVAQRDGAIVLAPAASGPSGGWVPSVDTPALACALALVERSWSIDRGRRFLWGFSAGAHYGHAIALANPQRYAAYAINAGALTALACTPDGGSFECTTALPQVARRIPVSLRVGSQDPLASHVVADYGRLQDAGWIPGVDVGYGSTLAGHTVSGTDIEIAWAWFIAHPLVP